MYSEETFKNYIFWIKVKRVFLIILFSLIGCALGVIVEEIVVDILTFSSSLKVLIIGVSTLLFFGVSLILTANTGKEVQDGYWKIAVLRKLTVISKKLDRVTINEPLAEEYKNVVNNAAAMIKDEDIDLAKEEKEEKKLVKDEELKADVESIKKTKVEDDEELEPSIPTIRDQI